MVFGLSLAPFGLSKGQRSGDVRVSSSFYAFSVCISQLTYGLASLSLILRLLRTFEEFIRLDSSSLAAREGFTLGLSLL